MRILITGATGLIGDEIVRLCHKQSIAVSYLTTRKSKIQSEDKYRGYYWNPKKGEIDRNCFDQVDAIINLAGASIAKRWTPDYKKEVLESRIQSAEVLYNALKSEPHHQVRSLVSASAVGIYPHSYTNYYEESETDVDDSFLGSVTKKWETTIDKFKMLNLLVAKVRVGIVLSNKGGALAEMIRPIKLFVGAPLGSGEQWQSWIHVTDVAEIFLHIVKNKMSGTYNGVAPNPVTNHKLTKELAAVLKRPLFMPKVPAFVLKLIMGEMSYLVLSSQRVSSKKIQVKGFHFSHPNIKGAIEDLLLEKDALQEELISF